jgi:UDP-N-acetylmuramoyl-tripeptide--D-alanyl-D-alanine ligase
MIKRLLIHSLIALAKRVLMRYKPRIIVVTGSVGKTSTKDAVYEVIKHVGYVRKSEKSFNSEIGVPLTILGVSNPWKNPFAWISVLAKGARLVVFPTTYPDTLVIELGADAPGDMAMMLPWLLVDMVVVTRIPDMPPHLENYPSLDALIQEELEPVQKLSKQGVVVIGVDNPVYGRVVQMTQAKIISVGTHDAQVFLSPVTTEYKEGQVTGISFAISHKGVSENIVLEGVLGEPHAESILHAAGVACALSIPLSHLSEALLQYEPPRGRMRLIEGVNASTLIDDAYNANPRSCEAALQALKEVRAPHKVAFLGDMLELGSVSEEGHRLVGRIAARSLDTLVVVGERAKGIQEGALEMGMNPDAVHWYPDSKLASEVALTHVPDSSVVLIKGSQGVRMERVTVALMRHPERALKETIRQESEWKRKG